MQNQHIWKVCNLGKKPPVANFGLSAFHKQSEVLLQIICTDVLIR